MWKPFRWVILLLLVLSQNLFSQNYTNSPYTRFKIGDLTNSGFAYNVALGGTSIGLRPKNNVNYLNPASYTGQDTNSFLFHIGFAGRYAQNISNIDSNKSANFNIDYLAVGFPIKKWWSMSVGVTPFSRVQYNITEERNDPTVGEKMTFDYTGFGGFNEFYIGTAFKLGNIVSIGANAGYLFGSLDKKEISYLTDLTTYSAKIEHTTNYIAGDFYYKLGFQFHPVIKEKHTFVLGATYDIESNIDVKMKSTTNRYNTTAGNEFFDDSIKFSIDTVAPLFLPAKIAVGLSYNYKNTFLVTGEYIQQDWTGTNIAVSRFETGMYASYRFGVAFVPAPLDNKTRVSYLKRMHYIAGANYTDTYLYHNNKSISCWGISGGLGFPIKNSRKVFSGTMFNIGYQYGARGTTDDGFIKEEYQFISFGLTLHDFWFLKPKYD